MRSFERIFCVVYSLGPLVGLAGVHERKCALFMHGANSVSRCAQDMNGGGFEMNRVPIAILTAMAVLCQYAGETNMADVAALQTKIHDLEKEIKRLSAQMKTEKYGLRWVECPEAFEAESENKIPILAEVPEKAITNKDGKPTHILIEGDNYHALTCLNFTHRGKIDVIYIDPPYNTGSDGFTYKDKRFLEKYPDGEKIGKDHPLRHSAWLSFMSKRLKLAKALLKDTGVIFMSINEDEYANLKLLSDSVFGEANYITTFTIKVRHEDRILKGDKPIHETTEFLLMYQKSPHFRIQKRTVDNSDPSEYRYAIEELIENPEKLEMGGRTVEVFQPGQFKIVEKEPAFSNLKKINIRGSIKAGNSSGRFHMTYLEPLKDKFGVLYKVPNIGDDGLGYRYFISRSSAKMANGSYFQGSPLNRKDVREIPYPNYFDFESDFNDVGTEGGVAFDGGKKPIEFIKTMLKIATAKKDIVVLDFFAGSGSTMHAVASLNQDGGSRCSIGVQNADNTYEVIKGKRVALKGCENAFNAGFMRIVDITHQRYENVIGGYRSAKGEEYSPLGGGLKYYKTDFVGKHRCAEALDEDRSALAAKAGTLLAMAEETLEGENVSAKAAKFWQHFSNGGHRHTMIYFSDDLSGFASLVEKAEQVRTKDKAAKIAVYVFTIGSVEGFENEFDDMRHITLKPIPEPILAIYKAINGD